MSTPTNAPRRRKKATDLVVDQRLRARAERLGLNLSPLLEAGLAEANRRQQREAWLRRNRRALDAYNEHIEKHGAFSDGLRAF
ncbi:MAG: type II toxin-antitoxin system CcdA family antitoxin [Betaproteobacteria bacterium]|nr:type II toxin-antitoxin system CcdA family antitoxin [Betaproteobacteria bacterium]